MKIISVVGARPNFMKVAPLHRVFSSDPTIESIIVHTGQHYDERMSQVFFDQWGCPSPIIIGALAEVHIQSRPPRLCWPSRKCSMPRSQTW